MKKLFEALKKINPNISDDTLHQIEEIFESAVDAKADEKVGTIVESIDNYVDTVTEAIISSVKADFEEELSKTKERIEESVKAEEKEFVRSEIDKITEAIDKYATHAAEVFIEENREAIVESATVEQANKVLETFATTIKNLGGTLEDITSGKEGSDMNENLDRAIRKNERMKEELRETKNKLFLTESLQSLNMVTASKLEDVMQNELHLDESRFQEKVKTMIDVFKSSSVNEDDENYNKQNRKERSKRKITI